MSRSNPNERIPNPTKRWFEYKANTGNVRRWDATIEKEVVDPLPFTFLLLDELKTITGYNGEKRLFANEVRDTTTDPFIVKMFGGGTIAEGVYQAIKKDIEVESGKFTASLYLAYKQDDGTYALGNLKLHGVALNSWIDFKKEHVADLYTKAICLQSVKDGQKGSVHFKVPSFTLVGISSQADSAAKALDQELQSYLDNYLKRTKSDQADAQPEAPPQLVTADDIPF